MSILTTVLDLEKLDEEALTEKIVKVGSKWQVQSEKGRNMGTYDTKEEAEERLRQVHYFKYKNEDFEERHDFENTMTTVGAFNELDKLYEIAQQGHNILQSKEKIHSSSKWEKLPIEQWDPKIIDIYKKIKNNTLTKDIIKEKAELVPGTYLIINKQNGHAYVGKAVDLQKRLLTHAMKHPDNERDCKVFHNAINKYGADNFVFKTFIAERPKNLNDSSITLELARKNINDLLNKEEEEKITEYNTYLDPKHYNITKGGDGNGRWVITIDNIEEIRKKLADPNIYENNIKVINQYTHNNISQDTIKKINNWEYPYNYRTQNEIDNNIIYDNPIRNTKKISNNLKAVKEKDNPESTKFAAFVVDTMQTSKTAETEYSTKIKNWYATLADCCKNGKPIAEFIKNTDIKPDGIFYSERNFLEFVRSENITKLNGTVKLKYPTEWERKKIIGKPVYKPSWGLFFVIISYSEFKYLSENNYL